MSNWLWLPNAITIGRLALVPVLVWLAVTGQDRAYPLVLLIALGSDVLDGLLARLLGATSDIGAILDSIADALVLATIVVALFVMHRPVLVDNALVIGLVIGAAALEHVIALVRFGRPSALHTHLARLGIVLHVGWVLLLLFDTFAAWLFYLASAVSIGAMIEQIVMVLQLERWTPDIRGGLLELRRRRPRGGPADR